MSNRDKIAILIVIIGLLMVVVGAISIDLPYQERDFLFYIGSITLVLGIINLLILSKARRDG